MRSADPLFLLLHSDSSNSGRFCAVRDLTLTCDDVGDADADVKSRLTVAFSVLLRNKEEGAVHPSCGEGQFRTASFSVRVTVASRRPASKKSQGQIPDTSRGCVSEGRSTTRMQPFVGVARCWSHLLHDFWATKKDVTKVIRSRTTEDALTEVPSPRISVCKRSSLRQMLGNAWNLTKGLETLIKDKAVGVDAGSGNLVPVQAADFRWDRPQLLCEEPGRVFTRNRLCGEYGYQPPEGTRGVRGMAARGTHLWKNEWPADFGVRLSW